MKKFCLLMGLLSSVPLYAAPTEEPVVLVDDGIGSPCIWSVASGPKDGTVYAGPGEAYRSKGSIGKGQTLFVCQKRSGWVGIVYNGQAASRPADDCQLSSYDKGAHIYTGNCRSGWIKDTPLKALAH